MHVWPQNTYPTLKRKPLSNYHSSIRDNLRVVSLWSDSRSDILDALSTAIFNIGDINKINKIIKNIENQYGLDIEYLLEKEIDFNNQKIDLYITIDYGAKLIAYNKKILNKIFDVNKEGDYSENN